MEKNDMVEPSTVPKVTAMSIARILFQLNFLMVRLVNQPEKSPGRIIPSPLQMSEMPRAMAPCFSLAPLRATISKKMERMAIMATRIMVSVVEMMADVLLDIGFPEVRLRTI
jgi:hypothetical protein